MSCLWIWNLKKLDVVSLFPTALDGYVGVVVDVNIGAIVVRVAEPFSCVGVFVLVIEAEAFIFGKFTRAWSCCQSLSMRLNVMNIIKYF